MVIKPSPSTSRIILDHSGPVQLIQGHPSSSRATPAHPGPPQLIQGHPGPSRIIRPIQNQPGPSNQTPTSPFGSPLTWVTPLRSTSSIEVPVNWGTRPGLEPPQPGHSFSCWSYSVNSSGMAAISGLAQHLTPCAAPQALHSQSSPAQPVKPGHHLRRSTSDLARRNGKLQRQPLRLLAQTPHSVRVLLHKPRPGAPSGIGELFDAVDH